MKTPTITSIFACAAYREVLLFYIERNADVRGYQRKLADAAGCHTSYLSQVLNSHIQLTPDQAAGLATFWQLDDEETEYFLNLVHLDRCASKALKTYLTKKLEAARNLRLKVSHRIKKTEQAFTVTDQLLYYSAWYWAAIHVLTSVVHSPQEISAQLRLPEELVRQCLEKLEKMTLVERTPAGWQSLNRDLHLPSNSPLNNVNHGQWRQQAVQRIQEARDGEVHYTALYGMSASDYERLREEVLRLVEKSREIVIPSQEERVACLLLDCFLV